MAMTIGSMSNSIKTIIEYVSGYTRTIFSDDVFEAKRNAGRMGANKYHHPGDSQPIETITVTNNPYEDEIYLQIGTGVLTQNSPNSVNLDRIENNLANWMKNVQISGSIVDMEEAIKQI